MVINTFALTIYVLTTIAGNLLGVTILTVAAVPATYFLTSLILMPAFRPEVIFDVFQETILKDLGMFLYLALVLGAGIAAISHFRDVEKFY